MAIQIYSNTLFTGVAGDTKPTVDIPRGTKFYETDTNQVFIYNGTAWKRTNLLYEDIVNDLTSGGADKIASAEMVKKLATEKLDKPTTQGVANLNVIVNPTALAGNGGKTLVVKSDASGYEFLDSTSSTFTTEDIAGHTYKNHKNSEVGCCNSFGFGYNSLNANTGYRTIGLGEDAGFNNSGAYTNFIGVSSGRDNSGLMVNAMGDESVKGNTGCYINSLGTQSSVNNIGCYVNALGVQSAHTNKGHHINALGQCASANNTGTSVNALGECASLNNSGDDVNALGIRAGCNNSGSYVNFLGSGAGNTNSGYNVNALGDGAGNRNSGACINALGGQASSFNSGSNVNALGYSSTFNASGSDVNALGSNNANINTGNHINSFGSCASFANKGNNLNAFGERAGLYNTSNDSILFNATNLKLSSNSVSLTFTNSATQTVSAPSHGYGSANEIIHLYCSTFNSPKTNNFLRAKIIDANNLEIGDGQILFTHANIAFTFYKVEDLNNVAIINPKGYANIDDVNIPRPTANNQMYFGNKEITHNQFYGTVYSDSKFKANDAISVITSEGYDRVRILNSSDNGVINMYNNSGIETITLDATNGHIASNDISASNTISTDIMKVNNIIHNETNSPIISTVDRNDVIYTTGTDTATHPTDGYHMFINGATNTATPLVCDTLLKPINLANLSNINSATQEVKEAAYNMDLIQFTENTDGTNRLRYGYPPQQVEQLIPELVYTRNINGTNETVVDILSIIMLKLSEIEARV